MSKFLVIALLILSSIGADLTVLDRASERTGSSLYACLGGDTGV